MLEYIVLYKNTFKIMSLNKCHNCQILYLKKKKRNKNRIILKFLMYCICTTYQLVLYQSQDMIRIQIKVIYIQFLCVPEVPNSSSPRFCAYNLLVQWVLGILLLAIPAWALELDINRDTLQGCAQLLPQSYIQFSNPFSIVLFTIYSLRLVVEP